MQRSVVCKKRQNEAFLCLMLSLSQYFLPNTPVVLFCIVESRFRRLSHDVACLPLIDVGIVCYTNSITDRYFATNLYAVLDKVFFICFVCFHLRKLNRWIFINLSVTLSLSPLSMHWSDLLFPDNIANSIL